MATELDKLKSYKEKLDQIIRHKVADGISNDDPAHNALVESMFLANCNHINMYCGEMSVFRTPFYEGIRKDKGNEVADYIEEEMRSGLNVLLEKEETELNIYLENYSYDILKDLKWCEPFKQGVKGGKIKIYDVSGKDLLKELIVHTAIGYLPRQLEAEGKKEENSQYLIRIETDKSKHTAKCLLDANGPIVEVCREMFDGIHKNSRLISELPSN